jgi:hypothetical protein
MMSLLTNEILVKYALAALVSAVVGSMLLFAIKKNLVDPGAKYAVDYIGVIERAAITVVVPAGGLYLLIIPVVIFAKAILKIFGLFGSSSIFSREEPAIVYQKVRMKSNLAVELIASPLFAVIVGIILSQLL